MRMTLQSVANLAIVALTGVVALAVLMLVLLSQATRNAETNLKTSEHFERATENMLEYQRNEQRDARTY